MTAPEVLEGGAVDVEAVSAGVLEAIRPVIEREMREAANQLYGATMEAVHDYLSDNVNFNIRSRLNAAEAGRRAEWERAEGLTKQRDDLLSALDALISQHDKFRTRGGNQEDAYNLIASQYELFDTARVAAAQVRGERNGGE